MTEPHEFVVSPRDPGPVAVSAPDSGGETGLFWTASIVVFLAGVIFLDAFVPRLADTQAGGVILIGLIALSLGTGFAVVCAYDALRRNRMLREAQKQAWAASRAEAEKTTLYCFDTYQSSEQTLAQLSDLLPHASAALRQADNEFKEGAFAPFWDRIENAATHLAAFDRLAREFRGRADVYYQGLGQRAHTFPPLPVRLEDIPDARPIAMELRRLVRLGQTHFQFAMIWEHRKTREVLISGFRTLGEAVDGIGAAIQSSLTDLERSLDSGFTRMSDSVDKTRAAVESHGRAQAQLIDDLRRRRGPLA